MRDYWSINKRIAQVKQMERRLPSALAIKGQTYFQRQFNASSFDGVAWEPRRAITKKNKGKHLLVKTGKLRQSLQNTIRECSMKMIRWGTDVPYAKYQNYGTDTIPARPFLKRSKALEDQLVRTIHKNLSGAIKLQ